VRRVYLDHHAATPLAPCVAAAMRGIAEAAWANPASTHVEGRASRALLERAREAVAAAIGATPADVLLTAGGTEACNLGVFGVLTGRSSAHAVTTAIEHPAIAEPLRQLEARGALSVTRLAVPAGQAPRPEQLAQALRPDTQLVAIQWVNHETGTLLPVQAYAAVCRAAGVPLCVDATQALGKVAIDVRELGADLVALASHKIGGPAGAGALWVHRGFEVEPSSIGGGQERGRRAGTPDVVSQVGFGEACRSLGDRLAAQAAVGVLRDRFESALLAFGARAQRNAERGLRTGTASNLYFPGRRADLLVAALDLEGLAVSAGAACSSGRSEPSPVILAMHAADPARASASLRFSFGPEVSEADVDFAVIACEKVLARPAA
jgi:cysteine desulfurase